MLIATLFLQSLPYSLRSFSLSLNLMRASYHDRVCLGPFRHIQMETERKHFNILLLPSIYKDSIPPCWHVENGIETAVSCGLLSLNNIMPLIKQLVYKPI